MRGFPKAAPEEWSVCAPELWGRRQLPERVATTWRTAGFVSFAGVWTPEGSDSQIRPRVPRDEPRAQHTRSVGKALLTGQMVKPRLHSSWQGLGGGHPMARI